ncbi:Peptide chain release factor 1 [Exaiptasia diaphana]|nr:Peptide chain release factor 1 [Exaiptasia diaphana]
MKNVVQQHSNITNRLSAPENLSASEHRELSKKLASLSPLVELLQESQRKKKDLDDLAGLIKEGGELADIAKEEHKDLTKEINDLEEKIMKAVIPKDEADENDAILEVRAGAGGQEASLFAYEIFTMYQRFAAFKKWKFSLLSMTTNDNGGYKEASASISGAGVFGKMKFEVGAHRVQRVPTTETMGRVHTSTMTVAVLPQPEEIDIVINPSDLKIETFRASGAGGQHVNTTDSAVRITHLPTGIVVSSQQERSQFRNKASALQVLRTRLYDIQRSQADSDRDKARRLQIGTAERSEKIRTYNFPQDRVTDHRISVSVHGITEFLEGEAKLEDMINTLRTHNESEALHNLIEQYSSSSATS